MEKSIRHKLWIAFLAYRGLGFIILYPIVLIIAPLLIPGQPGKGAYILLLMAGYWTTEVIPIYVTALFPILLGPLFGVLPSSIVTMAYMKDTNVLFLGGVLVACAIEHRRLHRRIAIMVLKLVGSDPKIPIKPSSSRFIKNTHNSNGNVYYAENQMTLEPASILTVDLSETADEPTQNKLKTNELTGDMADSIETVRKLNKALSLCVCYASTCGGIGTVTGTAPNSIFFGQVNSFVTDTQPAILVALLALILPAVNPVQLYRRRANSQGEATALANLQDQFLLPWHVAQKRCPWGVLIILGGGYALSDICQNSGLSTLIGQTLSERFGGLSTTALIFVCCLISASITEFTSNAATVSILLPIIFSLGSSLGLHPFLLALPTTIGTSFAFSLPAATPPNSIVFGKGRISVKDMVQSGIPLNILGCLITLAATVTYAQPLFGLDKVPEWAVNGTLTGFPN
ncbi:hypothetical protein PHET_03535 [Paragonimus heterotremus]|uniref:Uncharacterized protein n=1 Tax=Paragonimus heterotremus TaxID=100268 RepID=A0A8J4T2R1_9TREM|nr:hypothetical protein PHET_03535 [Paragonimus heterotremus]